MNLSKLKLQGKIQDIETFCDHPEPPEDDKIVTAIEALTEVVKSIDPQSDPVDLSGVTTLLQEIKAAVARKREYTHSVNYGEDGEVTIITSREL